MKRIIMILETGEEISCGISTSLFSYFVNVHRLRYVPLSGDREYSFIRNIFNEKHDQLVSYKSVSL